MDRLVHLRIFLFINVFLALFESVSWSLPATISDENEYIMSVQLEDGNIVSRSLSVYRSENQWFIPFQTLVESLNVGIVVSPSLGQAEGDFLTPTWHFKMDKARCIAEIKMISENFRCEDVITYNDEIYIDSKLLESWFPIELKIDTFGSNITVLSQLKFPLQQRQERERLSQGKIFEGNSRTGQLPEGYEALEIPEKRWAGPVFEQQIALQQDSKLGTGLKHDSAVAFEFFGFETKATAGGNQEKIQAGSLSFSKKDSEGQLFGVSTLREVQAVDFNLPSLPLISGFNSARGFLFSSFPLNQPTNFSSQDFRGVLPFGWEVELYQNDLLIGRRVAENSTNYEFNNVSLVYGMNRFRLAFYGPQGQKREELQTVNIGQNFIKENQSQFRIASGEKTGAGKDYRTIVQHQYGISNRWTLGTSYLNSQNSIGAPRQYGLLGLNGSLSRFLISFYSAMNSDSGKAQEESLQIPLDRGSLGVSKTQLSNFYSDIFQSSKELELKDTTKWNASWGFSFLGSLRLSAEFLEKKYANSNEQTAVQRTSWQAASAYWFNTFLYDSEVQQKVKGQLAAVSNQFGFELRPQIEYSKSLDALEISVLKRVSDQFNYELSFRHSMAEKLQEFRSTFNKINKSFTVSSELSANNEHEYKILGLISYSLLSDPKGLGYKISPHSEVDFGAAKIRVFLDQDRDGKFSSADTPIENAHILLNQNDTNQFTESDGQVILGRLPVHEPVDLSISLRSLPDPLYKLVRKGIRVTPRPGHVFEVDFPVIIQTEIDGFVQIESKNGPKPRGQIKIELFDKNNQWIKSAVSESDGYFLFENINPGLYVLRPNLDQLRERGFKSSPEFFEVNILPSGIVEKSFDFSLEKVESIRNQKKGI